MQPVFQPKMPALLRQPNKLEAEFMIKVISRYISYLAVLYIFIISFSAHAQEQTETLISDKMCYACHQLDSASIGPSWRAIAARHADRKDQVTQVLAGKIIRGGGGNWGLVPMVPNQRVSEEQALLMMQWILDQAP